MQFRKPQKEAIVRGELTVSTRFWRRPQAKPGGRYNIHPHGAIEVTNVDKVPATSLTEADATHVGCHDLKTLKRKLGGAEGSAVYRITFRYLGNAAVNQPVREEVEGQELREIKAKLARMDKESCWTRKALTLIAANPGLRAGDIAPQLDMATPVFKRHVRKLKALGLTISLEVGYRLSPRGQQVLGSFDEK